MIRVQGNHMYAQVPSAKGTVDRLKYVLEEGKVYIIKKFLCNRSRPSYRPVESPFMLQFTRYTVVEPKPGMEDAFHSAHTASLLLRISQSLARLLIVSLVRYIL